MWKPTGTNVIPLAPRAKRKLEGEDERRVDDFPLQSPVTEEPSRKNRFDQPPDPTVVASGEIEDDAKRKKKSRWGSEESKVNVPGMPTSLPKDISKDQLELYLMHVRIEEINRKLRTGDYVPTERDRSVSPEPIYNAEGKRTNTREARYRKKLEDERHKLIEEAIRKFPEFKPPSDYKKPTKTQDKVYIPAKEFPEINFIGLLIGPRGNTLKKMESESGAKISIRGRGSVKEGKSRTDAAANAGQEEDLHCLVTADSEDKVKKAVAMIEKIIETSASVPEGQNELKRNQLRELAALNGTLRDDENQICVNCGGVGHRKYECPEQTNFTANLTCRICGNAGHTARDCLQRNNPEIMQKAAQRDSQLDSEYLELMQELGQRVDGSSSGFGGRDRGRGHYGPSGGNRSSWQSDSSSSVPHWQRSGSAPPPPGAGPPGAGNLPPWPSGSGSALPPPPSLKIGAPMGHPGVTSPGITPAPWATAGSYPPSYGGYAPPPPPSGSYVPPPPSSHPYGAYSYVPPPPPTASPWPPPPPSTPAPPPPPSQPAPPPPPPPSS